MGWPGDGSHSWQGRQAWTAVELPPRYPRKVSQESRATAVVMKLSDMPRGRPIYWNFGLISLEHSHASWLSGSEDRRLMSNGSGDSWRRFSCRQHSDELVDQTARQYVSRQPCTAFWHYVSHLSLLFCLYCFPKICTVTVVNTTRYDTIAESIVLLESWVLPA